MLGNKQSINAGLPLLKSEHEPLLCVVDSLVLAYELNISCPSVFPLSFCSLSIPNSSLLQTNRVCPCLIFKPLCDPLYSEQGQFSFHLNDYLRILIVSHISEGVYKWVLWREKMKVRFSSKEGNDFFG